MEIRHLRYFVAVAEELNFTRAAERLHVAQPPLSLQIKLLEEELRVPLFQRSKHRVLLTPAGEIFLAHARRVLKELADATQAMSGVARGEIGQLKIAFNGSSSRTVLPRLLRAFRANRPNVQLILSDLSTSEQLDALEANEIHIGIGRDMQSRSGIRSSLIRREALCLVLSQGHPLANLGRISSSALEAEPWIMVSKVYAPSVHDMEVRTCAKAGFIPDALYQIKNIHSVLDLVAAGVGLSILPEGMERFKGDEVVFRPIIGGEMSQTVVCTRNDTQSGFAREFVELALSEFAAEVNRAPVSAAEPRSVELYNDKAANN